MVPLLDLIAGVPGMAERMIVQHQPDSTGHCKACPLGGRAGYHMWPCSLFDHAMRAGELARQRDLEARGDR